MNKSFVHRSELWFRMQWHCVCYRLSWRVDRGHNTGQIKVRVLNECHRCVADQHRAMPRVLSTLHLGRHNTTSGGNSLSQVCHKSLYFSQSGEFLLDVGSTLLLDKAMLLLARKWLDCDSIVLNSISVSWYEFYLFCWGIRILRRQSDLSQWPFQLPILKDIQISLHPSIATTL